MKPIQSFSSTGSRWINQPQQVEHHADRLRVRTELQSDFWQKTWYGFTRHSGHAFGYPLSGDFTLQVKVEADFQHLYDQAGIFICDDEQNWVKAGIEYNDDAPAIGCVVTRGQSDWSTGLFAGNPRAFWLRVTLINQAIRIQYSTDGVSWPLLRLFSWPETGERFVGVMCCSPEREGLDVMFSELTIGEPQQKALHDLT